MSPPEPRKPRVVPPQRGAATKREERERVAKWGPFRAIAEVLKADLTRECARVLLACGHEATIMKNLTRARCYPCRPKPPDAKRPGRPGVFQSRPDHLRDRRRSRRYAQHKLIALQNAVEKLGERAIDVRTSIGRALTAWRSDLIADLGGAEAVSTQQRAVIDLAVKTKLLVDSVDAWLLRQPTLVHHKTRSLIPVVLQRQRLADGLAHYMQLLGLERRRAKPISLTEYLASARQDDSATNTATDHDPPAE